jgi:hypothetical protein
MFAVFCILLFTFSTILVAEPVRVIAIHYGNPDYEDALFKEDYPGFEFYHTDGSEYLYSIKNELFFGTLPSHLEGLYGEVPEKMGFSASFSTSKGENYPSYWGVYYLVGSNGVIAGGSQNLDYYHAKPLLRKLKKGNVTKPLPATKQVYFKKAPVGERESYKGSKIDKQGKGIIGWNVPDITVYDEEGTAHTLPELVQDETCMVVFYTMNAVKHKIGKRNTGEILEEYYEEKPVNSARKKMEAVGTAENAQTEDDVKSMFKQMLQAAAEDINEFYKNSVTNLEEVKVLNNDVK